MTDTGPTTRGLWAETIVRSRWFLSSYVPLFLILAARFDGLFLRLACLGIAAVGLATTTLALHAVQRKAPFYVDAKRVADAGSEAAGYLATYLLPFVTVAKPDRWDLIGYLIYGIVAWIVYVRSDLLRVNPTLYLFNRRVLTIDRGDGRQDYLIARVRPSSPGRIAVVSMSGVLIEAGESADTGTVGGDSARP